MRRLLTLLALVFASTASVAAADEIPRRLGDAVDTWSEPNPGLRYLRRTYDEPPIAIHAVVVDLSADGVEVVATPEDERWGTVGDFARRRDAAVAINGGFWGVWQRPAGVTAGGGRVWSTSTPEPEFGHFGIRDDGRAVVHGPGEGEDPRALARLTQAVSGRPLLVTGGRVAVDVLDTFESANLRQPRTAAGVSRDGRRVVLAVVDGRQSHSRGLTLYQLARLMVELGAHRAINLDGGGSSAMYVERAGGIVSSPARGRWVRALGLDETETRRIRTRRGEREVYVRGVEREVMNQLAVIAPRPAEAVAVQGARSALADGLAAPTRPRVASFVPADAEPVRLGSAREWLLPASYVAGPLFVFAVLAWLLRRTVGRARRRLGEGA